MTKQKFGLSNLSPKTIWDDQDGTIVPIATILLTVFVGLSVLALDGARYISLQTQLQNGADEIALAGAAELDGSPSAITRADNAVTTATNNADFRAATLFGTGANKYVSVSHRYLSGLPASDQTFPIPSSLATTNALDAQFIEVTVTPVTIPTILPASFFGGANSVTAPATAVAGFTQSVCKFTPMYICNPWEAVGNTNYEAATQLIFDNDAANQDALQHRQMMRLRMDPGNSNQPGNYGFLASPLTNGFAAVRDALATCQAQTCFSKRGVTTQTGFGAQGVAHGYNVRFDMYDGSMNSKKTDRNYSPALNVRKGYTYSGNACNADPDSTADACLASMSNSSTSLACSSTKAVPLPPDTGFSPGSTTIGNGTWNFQAYWDIAHPTRTPAPNGWSNANLPSRYHVYQYETDPANGMLNDQSRGATPYPPGTGPKEVGGPHCNTNACPVSAGDRRILFNAIINCQALTASGVLGGGRNSNIPVAAFGKFFLIHAIDKGPATDAHIDAEFVGVVQQSDNVAKNNYQLYR
jgi:Putative Flp pilus-assembly TadE/G-like